VVTRPSRVAPTKPVTTGTRPLSSKGWSTSRPRSRVPPCPAGVAEGVARQNKFGRGDGNGGNVARIERRRKEPRAESLAEGRERIVERFAADLRGRGNFVQQIAAKQAKVVPDALMIEFIELQVKKHVGVQAQYGVGVAFCFGEIAGAHKLCER